MGQGRTARKRLSLVVSTLLVLWLAAVPIAAGGAYGSFVGEIVAKWLPDNRAMELIQDFTYLDQAGKRWRAPKGSVVDGASIPRAFWSAIGGPFEGAYRNASVVHDVACVEKSETWQSVHRMFYNAMRANDVDEIKAALMYAAVYRFGPRWNKPKTVWGRIFGVFSHEAPSVPPPAPPPPGSKPIDEADVKAFEALLREQRPSSLEEIEGLASTLKPYKD